MPESAQETFQIIWRDAYILLTVDREKLGKTLKANPRILKNKPEDYDGIDFFLSTYAFFVINHANVYADVANKFRKQTMGYFPPANGEHGYKLEDIQVMRLHAADLHIRTVDLIAQTNPAKLH